MPTVVSDWISLVAAITAFLAYLEAKEANRTNDAMGALKIVIETSERTQTYLFKKADGEHQDRNFEHELAEQWATAAFLISKVSKDLSIRLSEKSRFWRNPDTWEPEMKAHGDISLETVTREAKRLMGSYA